MIQLKRCGSNVIHPEGFVVDRPNGSGDYVFLFFRSPMELKIQSQTGMIESNTFIIFNKNSSYFYRDAEQPLIHDWFHFDMDAADAFFDRLNLPLDTLIKAHDPFYISRKVNEIHWENLQNGTFREEIIDYTIRCLFMKLSDIRNHVEPNSQISKYYDQFLNLRNEVYSSPSTWFTVEFLAGKMNMSRSYFQHMYKQIFGIPVIQDLILNRLGYASYLLKNTSYAVSHISGICGYENDVHFMRQFKKFAGLTPTEYREKSDIGQQETNPGRGAST
ncbi:helix-turn-helix domain-containing protein [Paenibacillus sp. CN-4]|uniref:helix-turn-helix domain-containing protein n=1 Tax=Paenibacillus nanchangensis TaxID=3348343 RepID=UPI00397CAFC1